jgi:nitrogen fixation-related uncharacterized protein
MNMQSIYIKHQVLFDDDDDDDERIIMNDHDDDAIVHKRKPTIKYKQHLIT